MILTATQHDTLDQLIFRHYSRTAGLVEIALEYNPQLANVAILEMGQRVEMPDITTTTTMAKQTVSLWD
ncbi:tail protein X [Glaesserella parasuis]|uniref:tail protein X n=1 Tax=Glaesserella parasuis TaxID=738 RepID=UPI0021BD2649|nr:tail protein X [Glaesserella parasuis]MCT8573195.1 tail protein X [Glaesserella parasuis]MCT8628506.1 tail protein X [Glaesserella parasuis]MCT8654383.1 tail protein X [Glaesserella parasuis]MCT8675500.1 tail protein X [Glaesserella parasuis]MCT8683349.1 tail protein X [Glaesserella parasuis]